MPETFASFYDSRLAALPFPIERRDVVAAGFSTHVLIAGRGDAPPLLALPGLHFNGPFNIEFFAPLLRDFHVVSPDMPGQLGMSEQRRPRGRNAYGRWAAGVMDALGLETAHVAGISFGGAVALDLAAVMPERIRRMALLVPVNVVPIPALPVLPLVWRGLRYRLHPTQANLLAFAARLADDPDPAMLELLAAVLRHSGRLVVPPGPFPAENLAGFRAPTMLIAGTRDVLAPGERVARQARNILPGLAELRVLDSAHIPAWDVRVEVARRVGAFLAETGRRP